MALLCVPAPLGLEVRSKTDVMLPSLRAVHTQPEGRAPETQKTIDCDCLHPAGSSPANRLLHSLQNENHVSACHPLHACTRLLKQVVHRADRADVTTADCKAALPLQQNSCYGSLKRLLLWLIDMSAFARTSCPSTCGQLVGWQHHVKMVFLVSSSSSSSSSSSFPFSPSFVVLNFLINVCLLLVQGCQQSEDKASLACCCPTHRPPVPAPNPILTLCTYPPCCCRHQPLKIRPTSQRRIQGR